MREPKDAPHETKEKGILRADVNLQHTGSEVEENLHEPRPSTGIGPTSLLQTPPEVRLIIYKHLFRASTIWYLPGDNRIWGSINGLSSFPYLITCTNRLIRNEATRILFEMTTLCVGYPKCNNPKIGSGPTHVVTLVGVKSSLHEQIMDDWCALHSCSISPIPESYIRKASLLRHRSGSQNRAKIARGRDDFSFKITTTNVDRCSRKHILTR